jgi:hypothetical protein
MKGPVWMGICLMRQILTDHATSDRCKLHFVLVTIVRDG